MDYQGCHREHRLYWLGCHVFGAYCASLDIVSNVSVCAGPIDGCSGDELHLFSALLVSFFCCSNNVEPVCGEMDLLFVLM